MLTCKEVAFLSSKKLDERLTLKEKFDCLVHIIICGLCRRYAKGIEEMQTAIKKSDKSVADFLPQSVKLSEQSRERIKRAMKKALN